MNNMQFSPSKLQAHTSISLPFWHLGFILFPSSTACFVLVAYDNGEID